MPSPDRQTISETPPAPAAPVPTALRRDGTSPRTFAERLLMLLTLLAIALAVMIPTLVITHFFGQHPKLRTPPVVQPAPDTSNAGLRQALERSAVGLLPAPAALAPDPITVTVRADHLAARVEKIKRQAAQFGGTASDGVPNGQERRLFVDVPATASTAFRQAVTSNTAVADASPAPAASPMAGAAAGQEHLEIIIRPAGDDE